MLDESGASKRPIAANFIGSRSLLWRSFLGVMPETQDLLEWQEATEEQRAFFNGQIEQLHGTREEFQ